MRYHDCVKRMVNELDGDKERMASMLKAVSQYHPVGVTCNVLMVSIFIAAVCIAVFKGKIISAVILMVLSLIVRFVVMSILKLYLVRKYR